MRKQIGKVFPFSLFCNFKNLQLQFETSHIFNRVLSFFCHIIACVAGLQATLSTIYHARPERKLHVQALGQSKRLRTQGEDTTDTRQQREACLKRQLHRQQPAGFILFRGVENGSDVWPISEYDVEFA